MQQKLQRVHENLQENSLYSSLGETLSFFILTQGHIQQNHAGKLLGLV